MISLSGIICLRFLQFKLAISIIFFGCIYVYPSSKSVNIKGTIFNNGKVVRKAKISLYNIGKEPLVEISNRKGNFEFENINVSTYYMDVNHSDFGSKSFKIIPKKNRNIDLRIRIDLSDNSKKLVYYFSNSKPSLFDPKLKLKEMTLNVLNNSALLLNWKGSEQIEEYKIFRNKVFYTSTKNNFYKDSLLIVGDEYCYEVIGFDSKGFSSKPITSKCGNIILDVPKNIDMLVKNNKIKLSWGKVINAKSYNVYRNNKLIYLTSDSIFFDDSLGYGEQYFYNISCNDKSKVEGLLSADFSAKIRDKIASPVLSSYKDENSIKLIWNAIKGAKKYKLFRNGVLINESNVSSYNDTPMKGQSHCYQISSIDSFDIESDMSNKHCNKISLKSPSGLIGLEGVKQTQISWNPMGQVHLYNIYQYSEEKDSLYLIDKTKGTSYIHKNLGYGQNICYSISAVDIDGDESGYSPKYCLSTKTKPILKIVKHTFIDSTGNNLLDALENGVLRVAVSNNGESPSKKIKLKLHHDYNNNNIDFDSTKSIPILLPNQIEYIDFNISSGLKVDSGVWDFNISGTDSASFSLENVYKLSIKTKAIEASNLLLVDYSIENEFGTNYIPNNERTVLTLRIQNVGYGTTKKSEVKIFENHSFSFDNFNGVFKSSETKPGEYFDLNIPFIPNKKNISFKIKSIDYLDIENNFNLNLKVLKNYKSDLELLTYDIGTKFIDLNKIDINEIDIEESIPIGKKNKKAISIILSNYKYKDTQFTASEFANRDMKYFRIYTESVFGLDDYQIIPSKSWQIENGPRFEDFNKLFDPHQGTLRNRIITANKYSNIEELDIIFYYNGLGVWSDKKPFILPFDAVYDNKSSYVSLQGVIDNLSFLSVLKSVKSITIFFDIDYINSSDANMDWTFNEMSEKICILSSSSNGQNSKKYNRMKHSIFSYSLLKGLKGEAKGADNQIEFGELADYVFKSIPLIIANEFSNIKQEPSLFGNDLSRVLVEIP